jgi:hypothetical protein
MLNESEIVMERENSENEKCVGYNEGSAFLCVTDRCNINSSPRDLSDQGAGGDITKTTSGTEFLYFPITS